jgi:hypothetical protein
MSAVETPGSDVVSAKLKDFLLAKVRSLCAENDAELVFLTFSGSTLYGTRVAGKSDVDVRGLFLPCVRTLTLEKAPKSLRFTTGNRGGRNTSDDVDIDLWSLQYWLLNLLPNGDTGALDLLFSPSNEACTLYRSSLLTPIFAAPLRLISTERGRGYAEYSLGQAKRYGVKGSHLGALRAVARFLRERNPGPEERLSSYFQPIAEACGEERFCAIQNVKDHQMLRLCGKQRLFTASRTQISPVAACFPVTLRFRRRRRQSRWRPALDSVFREAIE